MRTELFIVKMESELNKISHIQMYLPISTFHNFASPEMLQKIMLNVK
jgi:hypothetical protein